MRPPCVLGTLASRRYFVLVVPCCVTVKGGKGREEKTIGGGRQTDLVEREREATKLKLTRK
jgi:hypothetical protein